MQPECWSKIGMEYKKTYKASSASNFQLQLIISFELQNLLQILHLYDLSLWGLCTLLLFQVLVQIYAVNSIC